MEGANNKRKRDDDEGDVPVYTEVQNLYDAALTLHDVYRSDEARWERTLAKLKDKGREYILMLRKLEIPESDPTRTIFAQIYEIRRAIGTEAGFVVWFQVGIRMTYGYASKCWTCSCGKASAGITFANGQVVLTCKDKYQELRKDTTLHTEYDDMGAFSVQIAPHLDALKEFAIHCVDQDLIMCSNVLHYWQSVLVRNIRGRFDPAVV